MTNLGTPSLMLEDSDLLEMQVWVTQFPEWNVTSLRMCVCTRVLAKVCPMGPCHCWLTDHDGGSVPC